MSEKTVSLNECIKEVLLSGADNLSHVTFFVEKEGMVRVPFNEFISLTSEIKVDSRYLNDLQALLSIFGDNFCFVYNDGSIMYLYAVSAFKNTDNEYGMVTIDPIGENSRWDSYDVEHKRLVIRKELHL